MSAKCLHLLACTTRATRVVAELYTTRAQAVRVRGERVGQRGNRERGVCVCVRARGQRGGDWTPRARAPSFWAVREKLRDARVMCYVCARSDRREGRPTRQTVGERRTRKHGVTRQGQSVWGEGAVVPMFPRRYEISASGESTELHDGARVHERTRSSTKYDRVKRAASVYACARACSFSPRAPWCVRESRGEGKLTYWRGKTRGGSN